MNTTLSPIPKNKPLDGGGHFVREIPLSELENFKSHRRLQVYFHKGTKCAHPGCTHKGTRLIQTRYPKGGGLHWDVYTDDLVLMTVDHILPKSLGGDNDLANYRPMCAHHNHTRGSLTPLEVLKTSPIFLRQKELFSRAYIEVGGFDLDAIFAKLGEWGYIIKEIK